jgi:ribosome biogenesis protein BRX1
MKKRRVQNEPSMGDGMSRTERSRMQAAMLRVIDDDARRRAPTLLSEKASAAGAVPAELAELVVNAHTKGVVVAASSSSSSLSRQKEQKEQHERDVAAAVAELTASKPPHRRVRVLVFASRGISSRFRHLMQDMRALIPHSRADVKMEKRDDLIVINEVCEMQSCNKAVYFEVHKKRDLYLWFANSPHGPSAKFHAVNVHTMAELKLTGNSLKGSRALLHFDAEFDSVPHLTLLKELFTQIFNTPLRHAKSKPFYDHIICFFYADGKIWFRNYQILWPTRDNTLSEHKLVEIGPRLVLIPIRIFNGSFTGATLYKNDEYKTPAKLRRDIKQSIHTIGEHREQALAAAKLATKILAKRPIDQMSGHILFQQAIAAEKAAAAEQASRERNDEVDAIADDGDDGGDDDDVEDDDDDADDHDDDDDDNDDDN